MYDRRLYQADQDIFSDEINQISDNIERVRTQDKGTTEPAQLIPGVMWLDDTADPWEWKIYDGIAFRTFAIVDNESENGWGQNTKYVTDAGAPVFDPTLFRVDISITINTWESVGPTGSGADNIWTSLDNIDLMANFCEIRCEIFAGAVGGASEVNLHARAFGASVVAGAINNVASVRIQGTGLTVSAHSHLASFAVQLDAENRFELRWAQPAGTTEQIKCYLVGYGFNR